MDTIPSFGKGIYIRGRVTTDDYAGNFYKAMVIQQVVDGEQQNLRISLDLGSSGGMYQIGQEILIRCNGLAVGRYANQPQLCVPSYNNNIFAMNASQKVGWAPGRIPGSFFRNVTKMIGLPDQSKLKYDTLTLDDLYTQIPRIPTIDSAGMAKTRYADGRLVVIKNVHFTGEYNDNGTLQKCDTQHPDSSTNAIFIMHQHPIICHIIGMQPFNLKVIHLDQFFQPFVLIIDYCNNCSVFCMKLFAFCQF